MISGAAAAVVGVIASIVLGVTGLGVQLRIEKRTEQDRKTKREQAQAEKISAAYGKGYAEGEKDTRAALDPQLRIVTSERDATRERCVSLQQEHTECARQIEALQAEIRRMQRGGKP